MIQWDGMRPAEAGLAVRLLRFLALVWLVGLATGLRASDLDELLKRLSDKSFAERARAATEIGGLGLGAAGAVVGLEERLYDPASPVRRAAAGALARIDTVPAKKALQRALGNDQRELRRDLVTGLGERPEVHLDLLGLALKDDDLVVRERAVSAIAADTSAGSLAILAVAAGDDPELSVRERALDAVARWFRVSREKGLSVAAPNVVHASIRKALVDPVERVRVAAIRALALADPEGAVAVVGPLIDERSDAVRRAAFEALAGVGSPRALEILLAAVDSPSLPVRREAVRVLSGLGPPGYPGLAKGLGDEAAEIRSMALAGLPRPLPKDAAGAVGRRVQDPVIEIRRVSVEALATVSGDKLAADAILSAFNDVEANVRRTAVEAAAQVQGEACLGQLENLLLVETDLTVRKAALDVVGRYPTARAAVLLGKILGRGGPGLFQEEILAMLLANRKFAGGPLRDALTSTQDPALQRRIVEILGSLGDPRVADALMAILGDRSQSDHLRISAARSLATLKHAPALERMGDLWVEGRHLTDEAMGELEEAMKALGFQDFWKLWGRRHALGICLGAALLLVAAVFAFVVRPRMQARERERERAYLEAKRQKELEPKRPPTEDEFLATLNEKLAGDPARPREVKLLFQRGLVWYVKDQIEAAASDLDKAVRRANDDDDPKLRARALYFLGKIASQKGDKQLAQRRMSESLKMHDPRILAELMGEIASETGPTDLDRNIARIEERLPFSDDITVVDIWSES